MPPDVRRSGWVTAETAVVGAVQPAITSIVLVTMGPAASVGFRVISTVSNALEPIIAYGRFRLLAHGHHGELVIVSGIFVAGLAGGPPRSLWRTRQPHLRAGMGQRRRTGVGLGLPVEGAHVDVDGAVRGIATGR